MILEMFTLPFMQRAFIAGLVSALLLGSLGVYVISREMSFAGDGIAHASLAGIALALLFGWAPIPIALIVGVIVAVSVYAIEKNTVVSRDAAIGILFTTGMSIGIVLLQFHDGFQPELISFLFGNILTVSTTDVLLIFAIGALILFLIHVYRSRLTFSTIDPEGAFLAGVHPNTMDLFLYIVLAISIILSIKVLGIILVSALLVIPSSISKLFARSFKEFRTYTWVLSVLIVVVGLMLSYILDLPSGATIVLFGALLFAISAISHSLVPRSS